MPAATRTSLTGPHSSGSPTGILGRRGDDASAAGRVPVVAPDGHVIHGAELCPLAGELPDEIPLIGEYDCVDIAPLGPGGRADARRGCRIKLVGTDEDIVGEVIVGATVLHRDE